MVKKQLQLLFWRVWFVVYTIALAYMSTKPGGSGDIEISWKPLVHNAAHVPAYFLLATLFYQSWELVDKRILVGGGVFSFIFGILMEYLQSFTPNRYASVLDAILNLSGVLLAIILFYSVKMKPKKQMTL